MYGRCRGSASAASLRQTSSIIATQHFRARGAMAIRPASVTVSDRVADSYAHAGEHNCSHARSRVAWPRLLRSDKPGSGAIIVIPRLWGRFDGASDVVGWSIVVGAAPFTFAGSCRRASRFPTKLLRVTEPVASIAVALDYSMPDPALPSLRLLVLLEAGTALRPRNRD